MNKSKRGIFDYKLLADEFSDFVNDDKNTKGLAAATRKKFREYADMLLTNECYYLPNVRTQAAKQGSHIIGIPINGFVQKELEETGKSETTVDVVESKVSRKTMTPPSRENTATPPRQSGAGDGVGTPTEASFDSEGNIV